MNCGYGLKNKGAGVLPACCDIDRACPSLMQQRTLKTVIISLATASAIETMHPVKKLVMKCLIITDLNKSMPFNLSLIG